MVLQSAEPMPDCLNMESGETKKADKTTFWNVRDNLGSVEAMQRYDKYIAEHQRRLRQLEKEARGEMSPSGEWYKEY